MPRHAIPHPDRATDARRAVVGLLRGADHARRTLGRTLEPHGLSNAQYNVLRILRGAHPEPLATLAIAERTLERTPGITRLLDRLEAKGLVHRSRSTRDRRQVQCRISDRGLALLATLDEPVRAANGTALANLSDAEVARLAELLERVGGDGG